MFYRILWFNIIFYELFIVIEELHVIDGIPQLIFVHASYTIEVSFSLFTPYLSSSCQDVFRAGGQGCFFLSFLRRLKLNEFLWIMLHILNPRMEVLLLLNVSSTLGQYNCYF